VALEPIFAKVWAACQRGGYSGRTVTVKVKYADFRQITRSRSLPAPVASQQELGANALELLNPLFPPAQGVRLLGVSLSNLGAEEPKAQLALAL
jgi:DNA polymerase-4